MASSKREEDYLSADSISHLIDCPICLETMTQPKCLPCFHTFCLECLQKCGADEVAKMHCPLCKKIFVIPEEGFDRLPNNVFIQELIDRGVIKSEPSRHNLKCEICTDQSESINAYITKYCFDCTKNMCESCVLSHTTITNTIDHKAVCLADEKNDGAMLRNRATFCDKHESKPIEVYCCDCHKPVCLLCKVLLHDGHPCSELKAASEQLREELKQYFPNIDTSTDSTKQKLSQITVNKEKFMQQISKINEEIVNICDKIVNVIKKQRDELLEKLEAIKVGHLKKIEIKGDEVERKLMTLQSFKKHLEELIQHGSDYSTSLSANDLLTRAKELVESENGCNVEKMVEENVSFRKENIHDIISGRTQLIGRIEFKPTDLDRNKSCDITKKKAKQTKQKEKEDAQNLIGIQVNKPISSKHRFVISIKKDVELHKTDNPWKAPSLMINRQGDHEQNDEDTKTCILYRTIRGILNKITVKTLDILTEKLLLLDINTDERLYGLVDMLFERAISEKLFYPVYAKLAKRLLRLKVPVKDKPREMKTFRVILLNRCQMEFEKDKQDGQEHILTENEIQETSLKEKKCLIDALELASLESRQRALGNVMFIAELFKLNLLTVRIMQECIGKLLKIRDEISLECLSRLIAKIGNELDTGDEACKEMDLYFDELKNIASDKTKLSPRYRFMLQDVIELRQNKWVPRRPNVDTITIRKCNKPNKKPTVKKTT